MNDEEGAGAIAIAGKAVQRITGTETVEFVSIEPAVWPDTSMGWAEPGHMYAQMLTEGYRITARSAGMLFECRVSGGNVCCRTIKHNY